MTRYTLEFYQDEDGDEPVLRWLRALSPRKRRAVGVALFEILQHEGPDVVGTDFGKALGRGLFEFRLDQDAVQILTSKRKRARPERSEPEKILLRVFCHAAGGRVVLLLGGYDKGARTSKRHQQEQIAVARRRLIDWIARQRRPRGPTKGPRTRH